LTLYKNKRQWRAIILLVFLFNCTWGTTILSANPLLNINSEDDLVYELIAGSPAAPGYETTLGPASMYSSVVCAQWNNRVNLYLNARGDGGWYIKPLNSFTSLYLFSNEENGFMPGKAGLKFEKGSNLFMFQDGYLSLSKYFVAYYQVKESFLNNQKTVEIHRAYGKLMMGKVSFEGGIDNANLGPGEYGLMLSHNSEPYPLIKLQTEESFRVFGKWDFTIINGWLREKRSDAVDVDNPSIIALRLVWKPVNWFELGMTRTSLYGGDGRKSYKFWEYPKMLLSIDDNQVGSRWDNDAYAGYDFSFYIPFDRLWKEIKLFKFYWNVAATDMCAPWQSDDNHPWVKLYDRAYQIGFVSTIADHFIRFEFVVTPKVFYRHHIYSNEGYTYNGLSLGYPLGNNMQAFSFSHRWFIENWISLKYNLIVYQTPVFDTDDKYESIGDYFRPLLWKSDYDPHMLRFMGILSCEVRFYRFIFEAFVRFDQAENYDADISPVLNETITTENRSFFTMGVSASWRL